MLATATTLAPPETEIQAPPSEISPESLAGAPTDENAVKIQEVDSDSGYVIPPNFAPDFDSVPQNEENGQ